MAQKKYRPGQNCEKSGKYNEYNEKGKVIVSDVDVEKGKRFPPAQESNCYYCEK